MARFFATRIAFKFTIIFEPSNSNKSGQIAWIKKQADALKAIKEYEIASKKCCQYVCLTRVKWDDI